MEDDDLALVESLPVEVIFHLLTFVSLPGLLVLRQTSRWLKCNVDASFLWKVLVKRDFGVALRDHADAKDAYIDEYMFQKEVDYQRRYYYADWGELLHRVAHESAAYNRVRALRCAISKGAMCHPDARSDFVSAAFSLESWGTLQYLLDLYRGNRTAPFRKERPLYAPIQAGDYVAVKGLLLAGCDPDIGDLMAGTACWVTTGGGRILSKKPDPLIVKLLKTFSRLKERSVAFVFVF